MRIAITGACGFIGSHTAEYLYELGNDVLALDNLSTGKRENLPHRISFLNIDITDYYTLAGELKDFDPEVIVHLAAQPAITTSWEQPIKDAHHNIMGTLAVIRAAKELDIQRIIFSSTSAVYDERNTEVLCEDSPLAPISPYGISKLAAESYVRTIFPNSIVLRFGNVYGPRQVPIGGNQVIPLMIKHLLSGGRFCIHGNGCQKRDFIYVEDVASAIKCAITMGSFGTYNIASGESVPVNDIATQIAVIFGIPEYPWSHDAQEDPRQVVYMDVKKSRAGLGWERITSLTQGLQKTVEWWKDQS